LEAGVVVRIDRKQVHVALDGRPFAETVPCVVRGRFFEDQDDPESRPVAVGDRVEVELEGATGSICGVKPRSSRIARPKPRDPSTFQVIAANVDLLVIVSSLARPQPKAGLIDRLLVAAESEKIDALILLNKSDLVAAEEAERFVAPYRALGYAALCVSATEGSNLESVKAAMRGRTAMMLGHSGVGKSSLLRALDPTVEASIGGLVNEGTKSVRGAHTTTSASLHELAFGARLVDTPGVREFGLDGVQPVDLGHFFRDFDEAAKRCHYSTCTHDHEPKCGVKAAVESGAIRSERYETYRKLLAELSGKGQRMQRHDSY
jgi:ribosome biogenesis GTPase / thiamine phosphate phosphatase